MFVYIYICNINPDHNVVICIYIQNIYYCCKLLFHMISQWPGTMGIKQEKTFGGGDSLNLFGVQFKGPWLDFQQILIILMQLIWNYFSGTSPLVENHWCMGTFVEHLPWEWVSDTSVSALVCHLLDKHPVLSTSLYEDHGYLP